MQRSTSPVTPPLSDSEVARRALASIGNSGAVASLRPSPAREDTTSKRPSIRTPTLQDSPGRTRIRFPISFKTPSKAERAAKIPPTPEKTELSIPITIPEVDEAVANLSDAFNEVADELRPSGKKFDPLPPIEDGPADSKSIDKLLLSHGYLSRDVITLKEDVRRGGDKGPDVYYIKASNRAGDIVFVEIEEETPGYTRTYIDNVEVRATEGVSIPRDVKVNTLECAGNAVCGVAFECEDEICFLRRDKSGETQEGTFILATVPAEKRMLGEGSIVAYPIITLRNILENGDDVLVQVRKATMNIQRDVELKSVNIVSQFKEDTATLSDRIDVANVLYAKMFHFRESEVRQYLRLLDEFHALEQPVKAEHNATQKRIVDRLVNFNREFEELADYSRQFKRLQDETRKIKSEADKIFNKLFLLTRKNYDQDISASLRNATRWGLPSELNKVEYEQLITGEWEAEDSDAVKSLRRAL